MFIMFRFGSVLGRYMRFDDVFDCISACKCIILKGLNLFKSMFLSGSEWLRPVLAVSCFWLFKKKLEIISRIYGVCKWKLRLRTCVKKKSRR